MKKLSLNQIKYLSKLSQKKYRQIEGYSLVEGFRAIKHIVDNNIDINYIITSDESNPFTETDFYNTDKKSLQRICDTKNPQTIAALIKIPEPNLKAQNRLIYLDNIKDPGNIGAIFRIAQAAGIDGIIMSSQSCDPFNPKAVRSSMGCVFTLPYFFGDREFLLDNDFYLVATDSENDNNIFSLNKKPESFVLCIGSEAFGLDQKLIEKADLKISIPLLNGVESLNAAVAAGICSYNLLN